ncbi:MAG: hypothetical protein KDC72_09240, partial [Bacteroidetes bacterium]|nr:hypothetical protein [Bacteroidota bacterium]
FQLFQNGKLPHIWTNVDTDSIDALLSSDGFIAYVYENEEEYFIVNQNKIDVINSYSCPSIFALQYHELKQALLMYKNERIKSSSCELFKNCWADEKRIYFKNKPEDCMQISLNEFLKNRLRGIDIVREYNLGASKPVDVRVYWNEANRAALIEVKWLGRSVKDNGELSTPYSNSRANDGMQQIKEYLDLENSDTPIVITKGYLVVVDGRRRGIHKSKVSRISLQNGMAYKNTELTIANDKKYWETYKNIEKPIRMFAEPICEK